MSPSTAIDLVPEQIRFVRNLSGALIRCEQDAEDVAQDAILWDLQTRRDADVPRMARLASAVHGLARQIRRAGVRRADHERAYAEDREDRKSVV